MHKRVIGIAGAVGLLLAGIFVWSAEAAPLSGSAVLGSNHSLVEKADCRPMACCPQYPYVCYTNTSPRWPYCSRCKCGATSC